VFFG